ncbi:MAG: dephospho-CoA kinase [Flavobacteriales bacterium]|nr:MAG: dephospho-CoA kinase [Flavobacteriales bacterium]
MIKIGLTGGIGSGKSTVAKMFAKLGVPVYIADTEAKKLLRESPKIKEQIIAAFGKRAYDNGLNKAYLAKLVFNNKTKLQQINKIVHPAVKADYTAWLAAQDYPYSIQENALIYETNSQDNYDYIISVTAPLDIRIKRVIKRDNIKKPEVLARIKNQISQEKKDKKAHFTIENTNLKNTQTAVEQLHKKLLALFKSQ